MGLPLKEDEWGAFNPLWMAKVLAAYVPRERLVMAVWAVLDLLFTDNKEDKTADGKDLIETLVQVMGYGTVVNFDPDAQQTPVQPLDIEAEVEEFRKQMGGM